MDSQSSQILQQAQAQNKNVRVINANIAMTPQTNLPPHVQLSQGKMINAIVHTASDPQLQQVHIKTKSSKVNNSLQNTNSQTSQLQKKRQLSQHSNHSNHSTDTKSKAKKISSSSSFLDAKQQQEFSSGQGAIQIHPNVALANNGSSVAQNQGNASSSI